MNRAIKVVFVVALLAAAYWAAQTSATRYFAQRAGTSSVNEPAQRVSSSTASNDPSASSQSTPVAVPAGSTPSPADAQRASARLPGESAFLSGADIDAESLGAIIRSNRFTEVLDEMSRDAASDADAAELTQAYEDAIRAQLGTTRGVDLQNIACGLHLCALRLTDTDDEHVWLAWMESLRTDPQIPHGSLVESRVEARPGEFERRVIFSTAPAR